MKRPLIALAASAAILAACAAPKRPAADAKTADEAAAPAAYGPPTGAPQQAGFAQPPPAAEPSRESTPQPPADARPTSPAPGAGAAGAGATSPRAVALESAARELDSAMRELDVAAGDCRNACRALASMDRAAGRLCGLVQGDGEARRCEHAKEKLYSARDRVKATCGDCPGGPSVERHAPVPSTR